MTTPSTTIRAVEIDDVQPPGWAWSPVVLRADNYASRVTNFALLGERPELAPTLGSVELESRSVGQVLGRDSRPTHKSSRSGR